MTNRIPRPKHLTNLSINYRQTNDEQIKKQLIQTLLSQYTSNGFQINGYPLSLQELSFQYNLDIDVLYKEITNISKAMTGFINTSDLLASHEGLLAICLENGIRDKGLAAAQLNRMLASQGDTYKPFISSTVNQALDLNLKASKNLVDLAQAFIPKNAEIVAQIRDAGSEQSLTVTEATKYIRSQAQIEEGSTAPQLTEHAQPKEDHKKALFHQHNLAQMPDVRANPAKEEANMVNVKAKKLIEGNEVQDADQSFIDNVEDEWESLSD